MLDFQNYPKNVGYQVICKFVHSDFVTIIKNSIKMVKISTYGGLEVPRIINHCWSQNLITHIRVKRSLFIF